MLLKLLNKNGLRHYLSIICDNKFNRNVHNQLYVILVSKTHGTGRENNFLLLKILNDHSNDQQPPVHCWASHIGLSLARRTTIVIRNSIVYLKS